MKNVATAAFDCPKCGRSHVWLPDDAGRLAKCACGRTVQVPDMPKGTTEEEQFAWMKIAANRAAADDSTADKPGQTTPPGSTLVPGRLSDGSADRQLDAHTEAELAALDKYGPSDPVKPDPFRDIKLPAILIGIGLLLMSLRIGYLATHRDASSLLGLTVGVVVELLVNVVLMLLGVLGAARFARISFGQLGPAILKLCAIYVAPTMLGMLVSVMLGGDIAVAALAWGFSLILYYALTSYLFGLDGSQTITCVTAIGVTRFAARVVVGMLLISRLSGAADSPSLSADSPDTQQVSDAE